MSYSNESEEDRQRREEEERVRREEEERQQVEKTNEPGAEPLTDEKVYPQTAPTEPRVTNVGRTQEEEENEVQPSEDERNQSTRVDTSEHDDGIDADGDTP